MREPLINIAIEAARAAETIIIKAMNRMDTVKISEKSPNDFVTEIDKRVEQEIIRIIRKAYPHHGILGEEGGELKGEPPKPSARQTGASGDYLWIIDPIDGTRNFIHGFPHFAISIAISHKNKIEHGVIYDPLRQELFLASRGKGAQLNDTRMRVSTRKQLKECLLGTGFSFRHADRLHTAPTKILQAMLPACGDMRRAGAATLDLAYVACGRLDGFWEFGLNLWDIAAGILLVKEAGGIVSDLHGGEDYLKTGDVIVANSTIIRQMLNIIRPQLP